jgi:hypothetical protein
LGGGPLVLDGGGAGQRFQRGQQGLTGLRVQQPVDCHHALEGGGDPQPAALVPTLGAGISSIGVGDLDQVVDHLAQRWRVQPPWRLQQHRLGRRHRLAGELLGGAGQRHRMLVADVAIGQRLGGAGQGAAAQGSGDPDAPVGVGVAHAGAMAQPAGGGLGRDPDLGAGGAAAVDPGQLAQPVAFQPLDQPPQHQHPPRRLAVGQRIQILGGQLVNRGGQQAEPVWLLRRMCVRIHARNLSHRHINARSNPTSVDGAEFLGTWVG